MRVEVVARRTLEMRKVRGSGFGIQQAGGMTGRRAAGINLRIPQ